MNLPSALLYLPEKACKILAIVHVLFSLLKLTLQVTLRAKEVALVEGRFFSELHVWLSLSFFLMLFLYEIIVYSVQIPVKNIQTPLLLEQLRTTLLMPMVAVTGCECFGLDVDV